MCWRICQCQTFAASIEDFKDLCYKMPVIQPNVKMNWKLVQILQLIIGIELLLPSVVDGRVAGKVGYTSNYHKGEYRMSA